MSPPAPSFAVSLPAERPFDLVGVVVVSLAFGRELTGADGVPAILGRLEPLGPALVGLTLGAGGAIIRHRGVTVDAPGVPVDVVDTSGAGDVFHGALLAGLVGRWRLPDSLRLANATAALSCRRPGGQGGIPTLPEVRAFLASPGPALPPVPGPAA